MLALEENGFIALHASIRLPLMRRQLCNVSNCHPSYSPRVPSCGIGPGNIGHPRQSQLQSQDGKSHRAPSCPLVTLRGPSWSLVPPRDPSCSLVVPRVPSCSLVPPRGPSFSLVPPRDPSFSLVSPRVPSCSLVFPRGDTLAFFGHTIVYRVISRVFLCGLDSPRSRFFKKSHICLGCSCLNQLPVVSLYIQGAMPHKPRSSLSEKPSTPICIQPKSAQ